MKQPETLERRENPPPVTQILPQAEQDERLGDLVITVLDNFSMAWRLLDVMIEYKAANLPMPQASVFLRGHGRPVDITGTNCGLFVNPVVTMAGVDCRRSLEFFGLSCDRNLKQLVPVGRHWVDDLGIEHFGLSKVTRDQFIQATASVVNRPVGPILAQVHLWTGKQLAHFTRAQNIVTLQAIRDASLVMIEAFMSLLFDRLGRSRPSLNPSAE
jgi:hypothetical protein